MTGDSITQRGHNVVDGGWASLIADAYVRRVDIFNRGYSGYNTRWAKFLLADTFGHGPAGGVDGGGTGTPDLVTIWFGANDHSLKHENERQHVPVDEYGANLRDIVAYVRARHPSAAILLLTPPPVCEAGRLRAQIERHGAENATGRAERTDAQARAYARACVAAGAACGVPVVDLWTAMTEAAADTDSTVGTAVGGFLSDGLHLNAVGNAFVAERVLASIAAHFPRLAPEALAWDGPLHGDVDWRSPAATFNTTAAASAAKAKAKVTKADDTVTITPVRVAEGCVASHELESYAAACLMAHGSTAEKAAVVSKVLIAADRRGISSHGINRLALYCDELSRGAVNTAATPHVIADAPSCACVDGENAQGVVVGEFCMKIAIAKARKFGVGWVVARKSNHYGIAGYYARP